MRVSSPNLSEAAAVYQPEAATEAPPSSSFTPVSSAGLPVYLVPRALAAVEAFAVVLGAFVAKVIYLDTFVGTNVPLLTYVQISLCMAVMLYVVYLHMGLYEVEALTGPQLGFGKLIGGAWIALLTVIGLLYSLKEIGDLSRGWVFSWFALICVSLIFVRLLFARWAKRDTAAGRIILRTAIVGSTQYALHLASSLARSEGLSGAIDLYHCGDAQRDIRFAGGLPDLERTMSLRPYDRVVVAVPASEDELIRTAVKSLGAYTTELLICTDLRRPAVATSGTRQIGDMRVDVVHLVPQSELYGPLKRGLDLIVAGAALLVLSPFMLLAAIAIKLDSRGPVFFKQRRLGQNSSVFKIFKFRTMKVEEDGPVVVQATRDDERVTRVGRWLRSTSFDEVPQLLNVLLGQMSIVGPRPHAITHDLAFEQASDRFLRRRRVKPGITGWAQVNGFRGEARTPEDIRGRMEHDLYYIDHWSIWFDIEIMTRTLFVMTRDAY